MIGELCRERHGPRFTVCLRIMLVVSFFPDIAIGHASALLATDVNDQGLLPFDAMTQSMAGSLLHADGLESS